MKTYNLATVKQRLFLTMLSVALLFGMGIPPSPDCHAQTHDSDVELTPTDLLQCDSTLVKSRNIIDTTIIIPVIDFRSTPIPEALAALTRPYGVDLWIDPTISGTLTVRLTEISLNDALLFILDSQGLTFRQDHGVISVVPPIPEPPPPVSVAYSAGLLSVTAERADIGKLARTITEHTGHNVLVETGASGTVSGQLNQAEFESGLRALLESNGFALEKWEGIYRISRLIEDIDQRSGQRPRLSTHCDNGKVSLAVANADLHTLIQQVVANCDLQLFIYGTIEGQVSAICAGLEPEAVFSYLLNGTPYTYKVEDGVYFVGDKKIGEINTSELVVFNHIVAQDIAEIVPQYLSQLVTIKVAIEQNGLMISGPYGAVREVIKYLQLLDIPPAQILIEALVVDYSFSESSEFSITAGLLAAGDPLTGKEVYYPDVQIERTGEDLDHAVQEWAHHLGIRNIGRLPDDFYVRLRAMEHEGIANVRSRPQIATLNGHTASIHVGTTQYYLLETETVYSTSQTTPTTQVSERFETIDADISFEVTPWVTSTGEIIVNIKPEFKTPQGAFDPNVPPTINQRVLESTVRLRDGETIVLGGLIQSGKTESIDKFPILGDIPILGRIFQNRRTITTKDELVIYLTPHVYYGSEGSVDLETIRKP